MKRFLRRVRSHITRQRAIAGWVLAGTCMLIYALYPDAWPAAKTIHDFLMVIASVAAAAIFLPELSSNLWNLTSSDALELIPEHKIVALQKQLLSARTGEGRWPDMITREALDPLIEAGRNPHQIMRDLTYSVRLDLAKPVGLAGSPVPHYRAETRLRANRILPPSDSRLYWVSIGRTGDHIRAEQAEPTCLSREIVSLDDNLSDDDWRKDAIRGCSVRINIDGQSFEADPVPADGGHDPTSTGLIRWYFPAEIQSLPLDRRMPVTITTEFPLGENVRSFPIMLASYFCAGTTELSVTLYGDSTVSLHADTFLAQPLGRAANVSLKDRGNFDKEIYVSTGANALLWPGSGVVVIWERS